ncbi:MAG: autotransporter outer membrane beta-barrel domain-containing protein, partial [Sedimentisphaerales bacterium]|nr:autotransporter outer membrane beta-barrel domain-containing protein [Sedimentisphaerales bacterium]
GSSDKLVVSGDVNIAGGTVKAIATDTIVGTRSYKIIEASSVTGQFDVLDTALVHGVTSSGLDYDPDAVWLSLTAMAFNDPNICLTWNQQQLGGALQDIADDGGNDITDQLQDLTDFNDLRDAYDQLCGQIRPTIAPILLGISRLVMGAASDRIENGYIMPGFASGTRGMGIGGPVAGLDSGRSYTYSPRGAIFAAGNGTAVLSDRPWGIWAKGYGMFGDRQAEEGVWGYQYNAYGISLGVDLKFDEAFVGGITVGFATADVDYDSSFDRSNIDAKHIGIYWRYNPDPWYISGLASVGKLSMGTDRYVDLTGEHLIGEFDGISQSLYVETGSKWRQVNDWQVNPLAGIQLSRVHLDSYTETGGASALSFGEQDYDSIKGSLGGRITRVITASTFGSPATLELRARWIHEFGDVQSVVRTAFATNPDVTFGVRDAKLPRDSALLGTSLNMEVNQQLRLWLDYDVRLNPDEAVHQISVVGQYRW